MTTPANNLPKALAGVASLRQDATTLRTQVETAPAGETRVNAISAWATARDQVRQAINAIGPSALVAAVNAQVPLVLLPARLETRFADPGTDVLRVRIFPDDIHVDSHDVELTDLELGLGTALWAAPADLLADGETPPDPAPPADASYGRRAKWVAMVRLLGGPRAAWVAHATRPAAPGGTGDEQAAQKAPTDVPTKPHAYVRPPVARALPDRWLVRAYAGDAVIGTAWTSPVGVDLHLAPDPAAAVDGGGDDGSGPAAAPSGSATPPGPSVDPEMQWLVDYAAAVAAGMAVDVPLPAGTNVVDQVVAVGVRASSSTADAETELAGLLSAHRYTDGLSILPVGAATANTPTARSAGDRHADPLAVWAAEFGPPAAAGTAAALMETALGLPGGVVDGLDGATDTDDADARAMQTATWATTWGHYLGQLLDSSALGNDQIDAVRTHYLDHVRGRGTLPTFRSGRQPYGLLPMTPLDRWTGAGASSTVRAIAALLQRVRQLWQYGVGQPLTAGEGPAFDAAFTTAMSTDAVARHYSIRSAIADRTVSPYIFTGIDPSPSTAVIDAMVSQLLGVGANPLILDLFSPTAQPVRAPFVVDPADPHPDATVQAAIAGLASANPYLVLTAAIWLTPRPQAPATLLHTILRRSLLLEYAKAGVGLSLLPPQQIPAQPGPVAAKPGPVVQSSNPSVTAVTLSAATGTTGMFVGLSPDPKGGFTPAATFPGVLTSAVTPITGSMSSGEWLWRNTALFPDVRRTLDETLAALRLLGTLTADQLEILLPEVLDLATHRWSAWAESIAHDELTRLRSATSSGVALGGWSVVGRVTRRPRVAVDTALAQGASSGPLWEDTQPGGFVQAPSTQHAATAAVLRTAHLAHGGEADPTFAIDLSSAPARTAARLADGIRAGQPLGALLGYELERDLHQRGADPLIAPLRAYAPAWKASGTFVEGTPTDIVSPSAVVDGLALATQDPATVLAAVIPAGSPPQLTGLAGALTGALQVLAGHQHALADLLTAEGIHHALAGNTTRASAVLDAAHRGGLPPDRFEVLTTPRSGVSVTSRVGVVLPEPETPLPGGWPDNARDRADRATSTWVAQRLPAVARVQIRVTGTDGAETGQQVPAEAQLSPLDLVLDPVPVVLARLVLALPDGTSYTPGRDPAWDPSIVSLGEILTVAADLREVVAARALRTLDLLPATTPGQTAGAAADERDTADLTARVSAAREDVRAARAALNAAAPGLPDPAASPHAQTGGATPSPAALAAARAALVGAMGCGVVVQQSASPAPLDLASAVKSAGDELDRRLSAPPVTPDATADDLVAALRGLLGASQPAVPRLSVDNVTAAVTGPAVAAGDSFLHDDPELAEDWLTDMSAVRERTARLTVATQGCDALAVGAALPGDWRIVDPTSADRWSATLDATALATTGPVTTLVLHAPTTIALTAGSLPGGVLVDEWVEVVPHPVAATSVAYQAEAPTARAPQTILVALAPDPAKGWDEDTVVDLAREALSWARLRLVDAERGAWLGRMLPAVLLPDGDATDVIASPPLLLIEADQAVLEKARIQVKENG
jgi:hypothetical protein